jgi:sulfite reductase alpha subunit-like flavoprotein
LLSFFALDSQHVEKLREFASAEGQNDLYAYAHKMRRTTFEVLQDFTSAKIPLKYLLDLIPPMRTRSFSISSSPLVLPNSVELTVAIVDYKTKLQDRRVGVCTDWMSILRVGGKQVFHNVIDPIRCHIMKGTMSLPNDLSVPIICIGPGTGGL